MSAKSAKRFGRLLRQAVRTAAALENRPIGVVQDELGYDLGRDSAGSSIRYWSRGYIPADPTEVELLARLLVTRRGLTEPTRLQAFLSAAGHPQADTLSQTLLAEADLATENGRPRSLHLELGEAPQPSTLYGRAAEQEWLTIRLTDERTRLIGLFGLGGIGKTTLAGQLVAQLGEQFDYVSWRSLQHTPPLDDILQDWLETLSPQPQAILPTTTGERIVHLVDLLAQKRCLLVLDNLEAVLQTGDPSCEQFLLRLVQAGHRSCLLVTSRERPAVFARLAGEKGPAHALQLTGLSPAAGQDLLRAQQLAGTAEDWEALIERYSGNPLALKLIGETIRDIFAGRIASFLAEAAPIFGDMRVVLDQQFAGLSEAEERLMFHLAIAQEPVSFDQLREQLNPPLPRPALLEMLQTLRRRSLVESRPPGLALQQVIESYVTARLIETITAELVVGSPDRFRQLALSPALGPEYLRRSRERFILRPLAERLLAVLGDRAEIARQVTAILDRLRGASFREAGYVAANSLALFTTLEIDLSGRDFSRLPLAQAYLKESTLHGVDLSGADLQGAVFGHVFEVLFTLAFSPDGRLIAGGTAAGEVIVWQVKGEQPLYTLLGHTDWVWSVAFSPDGRLLASGSGDRSIRLWDLRWGQLHHTLNGLLGRVREIAFSPDGQFLAALSEPGKIHLWRMANGQMIQTILGSEVQLWSIAFHPHIRLLAAGGEDQLIRVWSYPAGDLKASLGGQSGPIRQVAFSPDGHLLAAGYANGQIRFWSLGYDQPVAVLDEHPGLIRSLAFSPDGSRLVSGGEDQQLLLWDTASGRCIRRFKPQNRRIWTVAFHPSGAMLADGGEDRAVRLWDVQSGQRVTTWRGYTHPIWSIAFHPQAALLASSGDDGVVRLWHPETGQAVGTLSGHSDWVWSAVFSPDGRLLASSSGDRTVRLWDWRHGVCLEVLRGHTDWVRAVLFSPDGTRLISSSDDGTLRLWNLADGRCLRVFQGHKKWVWDAAYHPGGEWVVSGSDDGTVRVWDVQSGRCLRRLAGQGGPVWTVAVDPQGRWVASGSWEGVVILWELGTGHTLHTLAHRGRVWALGCDGRGRTLFSGDDRGWLYEWDVQTGQCRRQWLGHQQTVMSVAVDPTGGTLASCSMDGTIKLWDREGEEARTRTVLRPARPYEGMNISGVSGLSPAQRRALTALGAGEA